MDPTITFDWLVNDLQINMAILSTAGILGLVWAMLGKSYVKLLAVLLVFAGSGTAFILVVGVVLGATATTLFYSVISFVMSLIGSGIAGALVGDIALWIEAKF